MERAVTIERTDRFIRTFSKIKDAGMKEKIISQIQKIIVEPEAGKPMRYARKGTRELYIKPYRLSYAHITKENKIIFLDIYHKDEQ